jgi:leucyl-tRNA synthetase
MDGKQVEEHIVADERTAKYLDGKTVKKVIVVPGRIVNVVVG